MRLLITGSTGRLGSEVRRIASERFSSDEIHVPTRTELDLEDFSKTKEYMDEIRPTHVVHLAAYVYGIGGHFKNPLVSLKSAQIDLNLFNALTGFPPKWIFYSSSVAVYSSHANSLPLTENNFLNHQPHESEIVYANVKRIAYSYLKALHDYSGVSFSYGIITNLFGKKESDQEALNHVVEALISKVIRSVQSNSQIEVWGSENDSRDFLSYPQAARVIVDLIGVHTGAINIASGKEIRIGRVLELINTNFKTKLNLAFVSGPPSVSRRYCSIDKLSLLLPYVKNFNPEKDLSEYITSRFANVTDA